MKLIDIIERYTPIPWHEGEKIPWHDPDFSRRMLPDSITTFALLLPEFTKMAL